MTDNLRTDLSGAKVPATQIAGVYPGPYIGKGSGRRSTIKVKTLKKILKKAGLKTTGKKSTLRARAKKARILRGGVQVGLEQVENASEGAPVNGGQSLAEPVQGGRRRRKY